MKRVPVTFTKKTNKSFSEVPGTIVSVHNRLLLASTGIPSLDSVIGGGLPVGSVLLVEEDVHRRFSDILLKCFLGEGVVCSHGLYVSSAHTNPDHILDNLPKPCSAPSNISSVQGKGADMKIAFMYQDLPESKNLVSGVSKYGHYDDISSTMDKSSLLNCDIKILDMTESLSRKEEKGLFKVHKLPCLNALVSFVPESFDLAFEMKRTRFVIECLHLPPDISETASRQGMDEAANKLSKSTTYDGVSLNKKLDF